MARAKGLDLVEISPGAVPPVAKIVDWGKYNYQKTKQAQKNKRSAKALEVKQMRFGLKISDHDLGVKLRKVTDFLETGHKVKITVFYRGRELAHKELQKGVGTSKYTSFFCPFPKPFLPLPSFAAPLFNGGNVACAVRDQASF